MDGDRGGFLLLYRCLLDSPVWQNPNAFRLWCYCLMRANWSRKTIAIGNIEVALEPGQFIFGRHRAAADTGMGEQEVRSALKFLQIRNSLKLTTHPTNQFSIVTIIHWASYQSRDRDKQPAYQPASNQPPTSLQPASNQRLTTDNKNNKENNGNKDNTQQPPSASPPDGAEAVPVSKVPKAKAVSAPDNGAIIPPELDTPEFLAAWSDWLTYKREAKQKLTPLTIKKQLLKLAKVGTVAAVAILEQSIEKGWRGLFPVQDSDLVPGVAPAGPKPPTVIEQLEQMHAAAAEKARQDADALKLAQEIGLCSQPKSPPSSSTSAKARVVYSPDGPRPPHN